MSVRLLGMSLMMALAGCGGTSEQVVDEPPPEKKGFSIAGVRAHAAKQVGSIEECYVDSAAESKKSGTVELSLGIDWEGTVISANAYSETLSEGMIECLVDAATRWPKFPARPTGAQNIVMPVKFKIVPTTTGAKATLQE